MLLRLQIQDAPTFWADVLPYCEFAYNSAIQSSTKFSPFYLNYGYVPTTPLTALAPGAGKEARHWLDHVRRNLDQAKRNLQVAQDTQKRYADQHRQEPTFDKGDLVLLSTKHVNLTDVATSAYRTLKPAWIGPMRIAERIGSVDYALVLPSSLSRLKTNVFHASMLKGFNTTRDEILRDGITMEQVVTTETQADGRKYFLVHWWNTDTTADTWLTEHEYSVLIHYILKYAAT